MGLFGKEYVPQKMVLKSRYRKYFPNLPRDIQLDVYKRMDEIIAEEQQYCDKKNYVHMCAITTSLAIYEVLQKHGETQENAYRIVSEEMWKVLDPSLMQKMAKWSFFLPFMKKLVPFCFMRFSGKGWKYTWHRNDPPDRFHFECNECLYEKIFSHRGLLKLGAMCCQADVINYGNLPYTEFRRSKTLCLGGDFCDFDFVRHSSESGWERKNCV